MIVCTPPFVQLQSTTRSTLHIYQRGPGRPQPATLPATLTQPLGAIRVRWTAGGATSDDERMWDGEYVD